MLKSRSLLWRTLGLLVVGVALAFIGRQIYVGWAAVGAYSWQWRSAYLVLSLVLALAAYLVLTRAWRSVLRAIQVRLHLKTAYWIFLLSNLGRYLPGKFWQIGAAAWLGRDAGLSPRDVAPSLVVYQLYLLPVGALLSLSWGAWPGEMDNTWLRLALWLGAAAAALAALWPHLVLRAMGPLARKLDIDPERWRLAWHRRVAIAVQCAAGWSLLSVAFGCFVLAVTPLPASAVPELARVFIASYLVGYLTLLAPGGLGVREGVMTVLLKPVVGAGPAAALSLLARLWVTVTEILAVLPALWLYREARRGSETNPDAAVSASD